LSASSVKPSVTLGELMDAKNNGNTRDTSV
jgi:hypothetical protein